MAMTWPLTALLLTVVALIETVVFFFWQFSAAVVVATMAGLFVVFTAQDISAAHHRKNWSYVFPGAIENAISVLAFFGLTIATSYGTFRALGKQDLGDLTTYLPLGLLSQTSPTVVAVARDVGVSLLTTIIIWGFLRFHSYRRDIRRHLLAIDDESFPAVDPPTKR